MARGCTGGIRTDGTWLYEADILYVNILKTTNNYDTTKIIDFVQRETIKYIPIQIDSFLVLANVYNDKRYMKKQYKYYIFYSKYLFY